MSGLAGQHDKRGSETPDPPADTDSNKGPSRVDILVCGITGIALVASLSTAIPGKRARSTVGLSSQRVKSGFFVLGKGKTMKLNKVIVIPALALTAGLGLAACGSVKAPAAAPPVTDTVTAPAPAPKPATPAPPALAPPPRAPAAPVPPAPPAPALTYCGGDVYAGADTSCPFALNVAADYTGFGADYAYSPVTGMDYIMSCDGGSGARDLVTCTGGDNALVEFYD